MYDLIIIGAGPGGITASVYAARKRMNFLTISKDVGGQTALSGDIENYTGYQFITGIDLANKFEEHMKKYKVQFKENEEVKELKKKDSTFSIITDKNSYETKTVIVATGTRWRKLDVPGEKEFKNRGLTYCATCDGPIFAGKTVAVIGGGNSGLEATLNLSNIAKYVYLIEMGPKITGDDILQEKVKASKNVSILTSTKVLEVFGDKMAKGIKVNRNGKEEKLAIEGVFVEIGLVPNSEFASLLDKNKWNEIKINGHNETSVPGIFAAGDVTDVPEKQIVIAAGEGAKAALSAFRYLAHQK